MICSVSEKPEDIVNLSSSDIEHMKGQSKEINQDLLMLIIKELSMLEALLKWSNHPRILLEVSLIKICSYDFSIDKDDLYSRLKALELKVESGAVNTANSKPETRSETLNIKQKSATEKEKLQKNAGISHETKAAKSEETVSVSDKSDKSEETAAIPSGQPVNEWEQIIDEIKSYGRMGLFAYLQDTKAYEMGENLIVIVFNEGGAFKKTLVSKPENIEIIEKIASAKLGRSVAVRCWDDNAYNRKVLDDKDDEFVQKAKSIADKLNIPLNIIDE